MGELLCRPTYEHFWHAPLTLGIGDLVLSQPLHFWINDGLMTIFFLVVGLEIRREIYEGALATVRLAALPLAAAAGGVIDTGDHLCGLELRTGIARRLGCSYSHRYRVRSRCTRVVRQIDPLRGKNIAAIARRHRRHRGSSNHRALLLERALTSTAFGSRHSGVLLVLSFQRLGICSALAYVIPGAIVWAGFLHLGVHPTLAGVVLGLLTPVVPFATRGRPFEVVTRALNEFGERVRSAESEGDPRVLLEPAKQLQRAQREILPPVVRVQAALHPWVAYGVMPLFAIANAGVIVQGVDLEARSRAVGDARRIRRTAHR